MILRLRIHNAKAINATTSRTAGFIGAMGDEWFNGSSSREADKRAQNSWKISRGLFVADEGSDWDKVWQVFSRHTWQQPMTELGYRYTNFTNNMASIDVEYFRGATVISSPYCEGKGALSIGGFIHLPPSDFNLDYDNEKLLHEYGHFLQTRDWGLFTLPSSFTSLMNTIPNEGDTHRKLWVEQDANARTMSYFESAMTTTQIYNFETGDYKNQQYYDNRYIRWWYLLAPDPFFITYYNVNNNPR